MYVCEGDLKEGVGAILQTASMPMGNVDVLNLSSSAVKLVFLTGKTQPEIRASCMKHPAMPAIRASLRRC